MAFECYKIKFLCKSIILTLCCVQIIAGSNPSMSDYLHSTLNKIQKYRIENSDEENFIQDDYNLMFADDDEQLVEASNINNQTDPGYQIMAVQNSDDGYSDQPVQDVHIEDLIKIIFSTVKQNIEKHKNCDKDKETKNQMNQMMIPMAMKPMTSAMQDDDKQTPIGYYYYYYPLKNLNDLDSLQSLHNPENQMPPEIMSMLKAMMPMKNSTMKNQPKMPVGPLFGAMLWFVGTAMIFILSILLLPTVRVKTKSIERSREFPIQIHNIHRIIKKLQ